MLCYFVTAALVQLYLGAGAQRYSRTTNMARSMWALLQVHPLMIWCGCAVSVSAFSPSAPTDLLCELRLNPVGIESQIKFG
eukprot:SAG11_NODE_2434_length_3366_cov_9.631466_3_plen_81_part_00